MTSLPLSEHCQHVRTFLEHCFAHPSGVDEESFFQQALTNFRFQYQNIPPYRLFCERRGSSPESVKHLWEIPAVPTDAFKITELTALPPGERSTVFFSSGTTQPSERSRHYHNPDTLSVYEASLKLWFETGVLNAQRNESDEENATQPLAFINLTPPPVQVPNSSLVHMFQALVNSFGSRDSLFCGQVQSANGFWTLDIERLLFALRRSMCANRPVTLAGTAFNFVHLLDEFEKRNIRYRLAQGSRVIETGGYKGQSRELTGEELHVQIGKRLGIPQSHIITEYGMSELSSQGYNLGSSSRRLKFPPWCKVQVVCPETGKEQPAGEIGLIRFFDLANVASVSAIQTQDLGRLWEDGLELLGRNPSAEPRGCSLLALPQLDVQQ